jgi:hypothetical protein
MRPHWILYAGCANNAVLEGSVHDGPILPTPSWRIAPSICWDWLTRRAGSVLAKKNPKLSKPRGRPLVTVIQRTGHSLQRSIYCGTKPLQNKPAHRQPDVVLSTAAADMRLSLVVRQCDRDVFDGESPYWVAHSYLCRLRKALDRCVSDSNLSTSAGVRLDQNQIENFRHAAESLERVVVLDLWSAVAGVVGHRPGQGRGESLPRCRPRSILGSAEKPSARSGRDQIIKL